MGTSEEINVKLAKETLGRASEYTPAGSPEGTPKGIFEGTVFPNILLEELLNKLLERTFLDPNFEDINAGNIGKNTEYKCGASWLCG